MMSFRAKIVAVVSSPAQAQERYGSLPEQVAQARIVIEQNGWQEVLPPLCFAQSRDFYNIESLCAASAEYAQLCKNAEDKKFDLIVGRDHSRVLGRTEVLQANLRHFFRVCGVQLYFYTAPVLPIPLEQLGRYRPSLGSQYANAIAGVTSESDIARFKRGREIGMNEHAANGRWRSPIPPFGYHRPVLAEVDGRKILGENLIPEPVRAKLALELYEGYMQGETFETLHRYRCRVLGIPQSDESRTTIGNILNNPAHIGVLVYGQKRIEIVSEDRQIKKKLRTIVKRKRIVALALALLEGQDARAEWERAEGVIVARGQWKPIIPLPLWKAVWQERNRRRGIVQAKASIKNKIYPLSDLLFCKTCGERIIIAAQGRIYEQGKPQLTQYVIKRYPRYRCRNANRGKNATIKCKEKSFPEHEILAEALRIFSEYALSHELIEVMIMESMPDETEENTKLADVEKEITKLKTSLLRWDDAYEVGMIDLSEWSNKIAPLKQSLKEAEAQRLELIPSQVSTVNAEERLVFIMDALSRLAEQKHDDRHGLKIIIRRIVDKIWIRDQHIYKIDFN